MTTPVQADEPVRPNVGQSDVLPGAAARRLSNQIARAFRGTYGARTGLRTIVRSVTRQMLTAGCSPELIGDTLETCVLNHPARLVADPRNVVTGELQSETLVALTRACIDQVVADDTQ